MQSVVQYCYLRNPQDFNVKKVAQTYPSKSWGYKMFLRNLWNIQKNSHVLGQDEALTCSKYYHQVNYNLLP